MGESRNRTGTTYALTVFTPILRGREEEVRSVIESVPRGAASPLARLQDLHLSRLQIFDQLVHQGKTQKRDVLQSSYLVFTAAFEGELDAFLDSIAELLPVEADAWWRHCVGYPGLADRAAFRRWIRHNQVHTSLFAVNSPNVGVQYVRDSLALRERVLEFAISAQGLEAVELQKRFRETFAETD